MSNLLLKGEKLVENTQTLLEKSDTYNLESISSNTIVPLTCWLAHKDSLQGKIAGVWLDSDESPELLEQKDIDSLELIALNFPVFSDGRSYSYAKILRDNYGYKGELRAIGDVLKDQLFFMKRCGFTSYDLRPDRDPRVAKTSFSDFSVTYQVGADGTTPVFHQR